MSTVRTPAATPDRRFGELLRQYREAASHSQEALAERAGMSARAIRYLERGTSRPHPNTLHRLAEALSLTPEQRVALTGAIQPIAGVSSPPPLPQPGVHADTITPLPVPPTLLIGREREVAAVAAMLRAPDARLVTLTGPGGTGKTRLSIAVAAAVVDAFADGVAFVPPLAALTDPELVIPAVASALGVKTAPGESLMEAIRAAVRNRSLLLVLDNFEHIQAAAPEVAALLAACPGLTVLVTSRAVLRLRGERTMAVEPLGLPERGRPLTPSALAKYDAIRLFVERARDVRADFALTEGNAPMVAAICQHLDGLPLAIELAAARTRLLAPQALLARLEQGLTILSGGAHDLPDRQRTLRDTIAWSYDLLHPAEQILCARLAIFAGGQTLDAIAEICDAEDDLGLDVLDGMESLFAQSLIRYEEGVEGEPRFVFLETIREFARERLAASGETEVLRERHAAYFMALAEEGDPHMLAPDQAVWTVRLELEVDNFRAALAWARERGVTEVELRPGGALGRFWLVRGYTREGRDWLDGAIARGVAVSMAPSVRARAFFSAGQLAGDQGDYIRAEQLLEESIVLYREATEPVGVIRALNTLGGRAFDQGDYPVAFARYAACVTRAREANEPGEVARALGNLGETLYHMDDVPGAIACYEEALPLARQAGRADVEAFVLGDLGNVARQHGDLTRAAALLRQALERKHALGSRRQIAVGLEDLAALAAAEGRGEHAACLIGAANALRAAISTPRPIPESVAMERAVAAVRAALGEEAWTAACAVGERITVEEAIAIALRT